MNWGKWITVVLIVFMLLIISFVYRAFQSEVNLVSADYYKQELAYDEQYEKQMNTQQMKGKVGIEFNEEEHKIEFEFPTSVEKGVIHFYRPSDDRIDVKVPLGSFSTGRKQVDISELKRGIWKVKIEWLDSAKTPYFYEHHLYIQ